MSTRLALVFGFFAGAAQARPFVIAHCPVNQGLGVATIILNTNIRKTRAESVTVQGVEFGTQTQVEDQKLLKLKYIPAGAGMYRMEFTDLEDGRSVETLTFELGVEPETDDELFQGTLRVQADYVNGGVEYFAACNIVNEGLLRKLAK